MNKADFFNKYRGLFQYDDYASTEENTALKSFILRADTDSALNSVPEPLQSTWKSSPVDTWAPASFGTTTVESNDKRMQLTTTGGITPRSPRSLQLEALETTQRESSQDDKLFHHSVLFSPLRASNRLRQDEKAGTMFDQKDLLGRAVDRANRPSPYKSPRQRLAQLTLAREVIGKQYGGKRTPEAPGARPGSL